MRLSLFIGIGMFCLKGFTYLWTGSAAILSDAAESVVHVAAVAFAAWGLRLSQQPPDREHLYGHEKVSYFSAGFEGAMITIAAVYIIHESIRKIILGPEIENLSAGAAFIAVATAANAALAWHLIRTGRRTKSFILVANGKHVLTDATTSLGVIVGLILVGITGWTLLDPLIAIAVAIQILASGYGLVRESVHGLMDRRDPDVERRVREILDAWQAGTGFRYHGLRHRSGGQSVWVDVHLLLPGSVDVERAHAVTTELERRVQESLSGRRVEITSHLEPLLEHEIHHPEGGDQHR
jgi:cation diffusion facilitator family transporter